jgi:hypothetical protein
MPGGISTGLQLSTFDSMDRPMMTVRYAAVDSDFALEAAVAADAAGARCMATT